MTRARFAVRRQPHAVRFGLYALRLALCVSCITLVVPTSACLALLNPTRDRIAEANRLFKQGKYAEAIAKYGDALVDNPESPLLNFNMGAAKYKAGTYAEAAASFARVRIDEHDSTRAAKVAYNIGNAQYRLGAEVEAEKPQEALPAYAAALVAYRRAIGADPTDQDAKFNYEYVAKKIDDLKKKIEEQQKQQDQKQQEPEKQQQEQHEQQEQQQEQPQQADRQPEQQPQETQEQPPDQQAPQEEQGQGEPGHDQAAQEQEAEQQPDGQQQSEQQDAGEPEDQRHEAAGAQAAGGAGEEQPQQMSRQEARALIDTARNDELRPDEFIRTMQGANVAEPVQDW